jgi:hypothetical protein
MLVLTTPLRQIMQLILVEVQLVLSRSWSALTLWLVCSEGRCLPGSAGFGPPHGAAVRRLAGVGEVR